jgi:hypothetical protein
VDKGNEAGSGLRPRVTTRGGGGPDARGNSSLWPTDVSGMQTAPTRIMRRREKGGVLLGTWHVGQYGPASMSRFKMNRGIFKLFKHFQIDLNRFGQKKVLPTTKNFK